MCNALELRPAADRPDHIELLLADPGLPTADVRRNPDCFRATVVDDVSGSVGGVEIPSGGLLRSVAVAPANRGRGSGTALVAASAYDARGRRVETLYLLTTTAAEFFAARGYEWVARDTVPAIVRSTTRFAKPCLASATVMRT